MKGVETRFSPSEIRQMENLLKEHSDKLLDQNFLQKLTDDFNHVSNRSGTRGIQIEQVERWFDKHRIPASEATISLCSAEELVTAADGSLSNNAPEDSSDMPKDTGDKVPELDELQFEAQSNRDEAWYDVATFLAHRVLSSGEPEVRVRYQGFGPEEDEWVNVKKAVRERSIPLESSECRKVEIGDLVLCYRERSDHAMYFDAHVLDIERKLHDIRGCRCLFLVKYDHDQLEEKVHLRRLCRRPSY